MAFYRLQHAVPSSASRSPPPWSGRRDAPDAGWRTGGGWRSLTVSLLGWTAAVVVAAAVAVWVAAPPPDPAQSVAAPTKMPTAEPPAAAVVAERFLPEWSAAVPASGSDAEQLVQFGASRSDFAERFFPGPSSAPAEDLSQQAALGAPAPPAEPVPAPPSRPARPLDTLLKDTQIGALKERLKLSAEQEKLWPAVESALRALILHHGNKRTGSRPGVETRRLEQLKAAAAPLLASLREDQKREVRLIAHVLGISDIAAQF